VADTRDPVGPFGGPALIAGQERTFGIADRCGIPPGARAAALNVTVVLPTAAGYLTLYPGGSSLPLASTINYRAGQIRANNAILPLAPDGTLAVFCGQGSGTANLIIDVTGYFE
jgi:hypothetical protein